ncbi:MAG: glycosyltransferase family 4 protein, partial [Acidobacteriota bacterium]|nr:glycosyltransferase family 4 protein [Acidobacteriota bacterium]
DMSLRLHPSCHPVRRLVLNRPLMRAAIRGADAIVTVSHSARRDLLRLHPVDPERVTVVHEAASPAFRPVTDPARLDTVRRRHGLPARFVLYVGTIEPRKNLPRLLEAFARARRGGLPHRLVCVGPYGWASRDLAGHVVQLGLVDQVLFTGYVPFEDLPAIYSLADLFVFPSLYEGFGLPVVEAMACGTPVVTSASSSLAEIAGDAAMTVDPTSIDALAEAIGRLGRDADLRRALSALGLARAESFSWAQAAREMLAVYRRAAGVTVPVPAAHPREASALPPTPVSSMSRESLR